MSFLSQFSNEGEITGWLDVKSELTREKGLFKAIKSPWKKRYCTAFRMVEVGQNGQRLTTIRLDTYPDKQSFSRSLTCQSYALIADDIVRIVRCLSSTRRYAFTVYKKGNQDDCSCPNEEPYIHLAGDSESDSQAWIRFFREYLFPCGKMPMEGIFDVTVIDNLHSGRSKLSGNLAVDAQVDGVVLLCQEDAHPIAVWPYSVVKIVELVPTPADVPQDINKIIRIVITGAGGADEEFHFFSRKPLIELEKKLMTSIALAFKNREAQADVLNPSKISKSHSTGAFVIQQSRNYSTASIMSDDDEMQHHFCNDGEVFYKHDRDVTTELTRSNTSHTPLGLNGARLAKSRNDNLSCPSKGRQLPTLPMNELRRGSRDDFDVVDYQHLKERALLKSPLVKQSSRDSGKSSTVDGDMLVNSRQSSVYIPSPTSPTSKTFTESHDSSRPSRGDSGVMTVDDSHCEEDFEMEGSNLPNMPLATITRSQRLATMPPQQLGELELKPYTPTEESTYFNSSLDETGTYDSRETIVSSKSSIDQTFEEGEKYNKLKVEKGKKNLDEFLGIIPTPKVPPKKRGESVLSNASGKQRAETVIQKEKSETRQHPPPLPPAHPPPLRENPYKMPHQPAQNSQYDQTGTQRPSHFAACHLPTRGTSEKRTLAQNIIGEIDLSRRHSQYTNRRQSAQKLALARQNSSSLFNLPDATENTYYDTPFTCDQCKYNCPCPNRVCSHPRSSEFAFGSTGEVHKDPSLVYDLPGSASLADQIEITLKQKRFMEEKLRSYGSLLPQLNMLSLTDDYDRPRGCHVSGCPCIREKSNGSPKLPPKMKKSSVNSPAAPQLPPKNREIII